MVTNNNLTKLDQTLREMAVMNWQQFKTLIGEENITKAKICLLRGNGNSYGEIGIKLGINKDQARNGCSKCEVKNPQV